MPITRDQARIWVESRMGEIAAVAQATRRAEEALSNALVVIADEDTAWSDSYVQANQAKIKVLFGKIKEKANALPS